jgi:predicted alpha/beta-fold hydrolase
MRGIASKAYRTGFNVIRMNQRTCGGTEHLTPPLYNSGWSQDYRAIVHELSRVDGLTRIWLVGYSLGGNLVLKAAREAGSSERLGRRNRSLPHHRSDAMRQSL